MARVLATTTETVHVARPPDEVFDYTQDFAKRRDWDPSVLSAEMLSDDPRRMRMVMGGIGSLILEYKLFRRGERTSAAFNEVNSRMFSGGGSSWSYTARDAGTDWAQTSTLEFRHALVGWLLAPFVRRNMARVSAKAMTRAKEIMESQATPE